MINSIYTSVIIDNGGTQMERQPDIVPIQL